MRTIDVVEKKEDDVLANAVHRDVVGGP